MASKEGKTNAFVPRTTQLDAHEFDSEIYKVLKSNVTSICQYFKPGYFNNVQQEIDLVIKLLVFKYSLLNKNSTFGQQLMNVEYSEKLSGKKVLCYSLLHFVLPYLKEKYEYMSANLASDKVKMMIDKLEVLLKVCQFLNLIAFLKNGAFPVLADRLLGLKMVNKSKQARNIGYNYMTRELLWHGFMELFTFAVPLINYQYIKRLLVNSFSAKTKPMKRIDFIPCSTNTCCIICEKQPIYPCRVSRYCDHIACYYCIKTYIYEGIDNFCASCGSKCFSYQDLELLDYSETNEN